MKQLVFVAVGVALLVVTVATLGARGQDRPGIISQPTTIVLNSGRAQAVPVSVQEWAPNGVSIQVAPVSLTPDTIAQLRQGRNWQYRSVTVPPGQDAGQMLTGIGTQGWEAVGIQSRPNGDLFVLMKKPL